VSAVLTNERHAGITPENLARKWNIGLETAKKNATGYTQRGIRTALHPLGAKLTDKKFRIMIRILFRMIRMAPDSILGSV
jgi:hypothetical protein